MSVDHVLREVALQALAHKLTISAREVALQALAYKGKNFKPSNLRRAMNQQVRFRGRKASRGDVNRLCKLFGHQVIRKLRVTPQCL